MMTLNGWSQFVDDARLCDKASRFCQKKDTDGVFIAVDAAAAKLYHAELEERNKQPLSAGMTQSPGGPSEQMGQKGRLGRSEFVAAIVQVAINPVPCTMYPVPCTMYHVPTT